MDTPSNSVFALREKYLSEMQEIMRSHFVKLQYYFVYSLFCFLIYFTFKSPKILRQLILKVAKCWDWVFSRRNPFWVCACNSVFPELSDTKGIPEVGRDAALVKAAGALQGL